MFRHTVVRVSLVVATLAVLAGCEEKKGLAITGFEPKAGPYTGNDPVVFTGHGFTNEGIQGAEVWFGDKQGRNVRFRGDTEMLVDAPGGEIGEVVDIVIRFDSAKTKKFANAYTYVDPQAGFGVEELTDTQKTE